MSQLVLFIIVSNCREHKC